jgi:hypothetical protein
MRAVREPHAALGRALVPLPERPGETMHRPAGQRLGFVIPLLWITRKVVREGGVPSSRSARLPRPGRKVVRELGRPRNRFVERSILRREARHCA